MIKNFDKKNCQDLVLLFHILDNYGISDLTANHASVLSNDKKSFYINQHKHLFSQVKISNLIKIDINNKNKDLIKKVNLAGYNIHKYLHQSNRKPKWILHTHSELGVAISCLKEGFITRLNQSSARFHGMVEYINYGSMATLESEAKKIAKKTKKKTSLIILKNHGVIILADTIDELHHLTFHFEKCSKIQLSLLTNKKKINLISNKLATLTAKQHKSFGPIGKLSWQAIKNKFK